HARCNEGVPRTTSYAARDPQALDGACGDACKPGDFELNPSKEQLLLSDETMVELREYEETMAKVYLEGKLPPNIQKGLAFDIGSGPVPGEMHLAAGQEPVAVGVCGH